jgi:hypothetical protein
MLEIFICWLMYSACRSASELPATTSRVNIPVVVLRRLLSIQFNVRIHRVNIPCAANLTL